MMQRTRTLPSTSDRHREIILSEGAQSSRMRQMRTKPHASVMDALCDAHRWPDEWVCGAGRKKACFNALWRGVWNLVCAKVLCSHKLLNIYLFRNRQMGDLRSFPAVKDDGSGGSGAEHKSRRVLVVSDIRILREGLAETLVKDSSFSVVGVAGGLDDALDAAASEPVQIILMDAALPDGTNAVARLAASSAGAKS